MAKLPPNPSSIMSVSYTHLEMQGLIDQGSDKEFIVKMAREKLGLIFPDERVFFNTSGNQ